MSKHLTPIVHVKLTTTQRNSLTAEEGMEIYNLTTDQLEYYNGTIWTFPGGSPAIKAGLIGYIPATMPNAVTILLHIFDTITTFPIGIPGSIAECNDDPSLVVVLPINLKVSGGSTSGVGTITFSPSSNTGVLSFTTEVVAQVGDIMYIESPADTGGLADVFLNVLGYSELPVY